MTGVRKPDISRSFGTWSRWSGVVLAAILALSSISQHIDWWLEDAFALFDQKVSTNNVTVVGIDRKSLDQLGDRVFDPVTRAKTIKHLLNAGATRIFVDFGMAQLGSEETARQVLSLLGDDIRSRVAFPVFSASRSSAEGVTNVEGRPDQVIQDIASLASVSVPIDADGSARRMFSRGIFDGTPIASAPGWLAGVHGTLPSEFRVNFGIRLNEIPTLSMADVWRGQFDQELVRNRLIVIGATDLILGDQLVVPRYSIIAGCEFLALAALTLLNDLTLSEVDRSIVLGLTIAIVLLAFYVFQQKRPRKIILLAAVGILALVAIAAFAQIYLSVLVQPAAPAMGLVIAALIAVLQSSGLMERRQVLSDRIIDQQSELIGKFLSSSRDGILTINANGQVVNANSAMTELWGQDPKGLSAHGVIPCFDDITGTISSDRSLILETELTPPHSDGIPVEIAFSRSLHEETAITIAMVRDVRERKAHERQLTSLATQDSLTGIANRYLFEQTLSHMAEEAREEAGRFLVVLIDLDQFKEVNDTLGHHVGDAILTAVAQRLSSFEDEVSCIARLGGDEFAVISKIASSADEAREIVDIAYEKLTESYRLLGMSFELGASIGIAQYPDDGADHSKLLQCADVAMYKAKQLGGGIICYDSDQDENSVRRLTLKGQLRQAIENDELILHYQPKVCAVRGTLVGSEALVRWIHPDLGFMPPDEFIPAAEQSGLIEPLTTWCFERALKDKTLMPESLRCLPVSVNVSARLLGQPEIVETVIGLIEKYEAKSSDLTLEITESALMVQVEQSLAILNRLNEHGFKLSLDDFGAGYSSFDYLRQLPVKELKIDRAFLVARQNDQRAGVILRGMIDLGHQLNLSVVCEGAETLDDLLWLRENKCDIIQGYFTGRPMEIGKFCQLPTELVPALHEFSG